MDHAPVYPVPAQGRTRGAIDASSVDALAEAFAFFPYADTFVTA